MTKRVASNDRATGRGSGGVTGKGFRPGRSGNPEGRAKTDPELVEAFRARTPRALATLDKVMADFAADATTEKGDPLIPAAAAVKAAEVTLNRGWGTAPTTVKLDANLKTEVTHDVKREAADPSRLKRVAEVLLRAGVLSLEPKDVESK